jgi:hypothetical protein
MLTWVSGDRYIEIRVLTRYGYAKYSCEPLGEQCGDWGPDTIDNQINSYEADINGKIMRNEHS